MGIDTLSNELANLSAQMERDIGKVYRKYERLERTIRTERDKRIKEREEMLRRQHKSTPAIGGNLPKVS